MRDPQHKPPLEQFNQPGQARLHPNTGDSTDWAPFCHCPQLAVTGDPLHLLTAVSKHDFSPFTAGLRSRCLRNKTKTFHFLMVWKVKKLSIKSELWVQYLDVELSCRWLHHQSLLMSHMDQLLLDYKPENGRVNRPFHSSHLKLNTRRWHKDEAFTNVFNDAQAFVCSEEVPSMISLKASLCRFRLNICFYVVSLKLWLLLRNQSIWDFLRVCLRLRKSAARKERFIHLSSTWGIHELQTVSRCSLSDSVCSAACLKQSRPRLLVISRNQCLTLW